MIERGRGEGARGYHHGNLREALVAAGLELARTGGPNAVVLRAASREAGVSHNAVYRHFANQEDLLAAVAQRCMVRLSELMIERTEQVRTRERVRRAGARLEAETIIGVGAVVPPGTHLSGGRLPPGPDG